MRMGINIRTNYLHFVCRGNGLTIHVEEESGREVSSHFVSLFLHVLRRLWLPATPTEPTETYRLLDLGCAGHSVYPVRAVRPSQAGCYTLKYMRT